MVIFSIIIVYSSKRPGIEAIGMCVISLCIHNLVRGGTDLNRVRSRLQKKRYVTAVHGCGNHISGCMPVINVCNQCLVALYTAL